MEPGKSKNQKNNAEVNKPSNLKPKPVAVEAGGSIASKPEGGVEKLVEETDRLRVGQNKVRLSGAAFKRFKFLLKEGYSNTEARRLALLKKEEFIVPRKGGRTQDQQETLKKRPRSEEKSPRDAKRPRQKDNTQEARRQKETSYKGALVGIKMAVMSRRFPTDLLTTDQMDKICSALMDVVEERYEGSIKPEFLTSVYKAGYLMLLCKDMATVEWIKAVVVDLHPWEGSELWATKEADIPQGCILVGYFPNSAEMPAEKMLHRIQGQNHGINTSTWRVVKKEARGTSALLILSIDQNSGSIVESLGNKVSFGFKEVAVKVRKPHEPPMEEEKSDPQNTTTKEEEESNPQNISNREEEKSDSQNVITTEGEQSDSQDTFTMEVSEVGGTDPQSSVSS